MFQLQVIIGNASLKWAVPRFGESVVFERDGPSWRKIPDADGTGQAQFITQDGIAVVVLCFKGTECSHLKYNLQSGSIRDNARSFYAICFISATFFATQLSIPGVLAMNSAV